jgi:hypothetical protein
MWWLYYRNEGELVGVAIIAAPSLYHARMRAAVDGIGRAANYSEGKELDAEHAALVPKEHLGRMLSPEEARQLIDRMGVAKAGGAPPPELVKVDAVMAEKPRGLYRTRGPGDLTNDAWVTDGTLGFHVPEQLYRARGYEPAFDDLPLKDYQAANPTETANV